VETYSVVLASSEEPVLSAGIDCPVARPIHNSEVSDLRGRATGNSASFYSLSVNLQMHHCRKSVDGTSKAKRAKRSSEASCGKAVRMAGVTHGYSLLAVPGAIVRGGCS
jgi:hypothetical protein